MLLGCYTSSTLEALIICHTKNKIRFNFEII